MYYPELRFVLSAQIGIGTLETVLIFGTSLIGMAKEESGDISGRTVEKPIKDESEDRFDRKEYAKAIADRIIKTKEGFNFGISGAWGSGKTSMLRMIQPHLEKAGFKVIWYIPWKYAEDELSLRRTFLMNMAEELKVDHPQNLYETIKFPEEKSLGDKFQILGKVVIWFIAYLAFLSAVFLLVLGLIWLAVPTIDILNIYATLLIIPALGALIPAFKSYLENVTIERTDPKVVYVEQFDKLFNDILKKSDNGKLVFFIDDLDRCRGDEIIRVLSGLMTFFENRNVHFIITADHHVIENTLDKTLEKKDADEYLKKIFQINWILPPIPPEVIRNYIDNELPESITQTGIPYVRTYLIQMIMKNFEAVPRQILFFIRDLEFQIETLEARIRQLESKGEEEQKEELAYLKEVRKHPDLLAKIMILRSKYAEDYRHVIQRPQDISRIENEEDIKLADSQARALFKNHPHFSRRKIDPQYFIFLSGQTGFEEKITADPTKVPEYAKSEDLDNLNKVMEGSSDHKRSERIDLIIDAIKNPKNNNERVSLSRSMLSVVNLIEDRRSKKEKIHRFLELLHEHQEIIKGLQPEFWEQIFRALQNDSKSIDYARRLFNDDKYTPPPIRNPVWQGLINAKSDTAPEILSLFSKRVLVQLDQEEGEQDVAMEFLRLFGDGLKSCDNKEEVIDRVLGVFDGRAIDKKQKPLDALMEVAEAINQNQKKAFELNLIDLAKADLQSTNFVINNLDRIAKILKPSIVIGAIVDEFPSKPLQEMQQILGNLKSHHKMMNNNQKKEIFDSLMESLKTGSGQEMQILELIQANLDLLPPHSQSRRAILHQLLKIIESKPPEPYPKMLEVFWSLKGGWKDDKKIIADFRKLLEEHSNDENERISSHSRNYLSKFQERES